MDVNHIQNLSHKFKHLSKSDDLDTIKSKLTNIPKNKRASISLEDISSRSVKVFDQNFFQRISSNESITSSISCSSNEHIFPLNHQFSPRKIEFNVKFWKINHIIYTIDETLEYLSENIIDSSPIERKCKRVINKSNILRKRPLSRRTLNKPRNIIHDSEKIEKTEMESKIAKKNKSFLTCISFKHIKALFGCTKLKTKKYVQIQ